MKVFKRKDNKSRYLNRTIIGLGYGLIKTREFILNKEFGVSTQDAMDSLSIWIGRELMKSLLENKVASVKESDDNLINALMGVINLAEVLDVEVTDEKVKLVVQKCLICPKRVGGYDLEGNTACPVGGLLTGAISYARGIDPHITKNRLQAAEICHIEMEYQM